VTAALELAWIVGNATLHVLDLRAPARESVLIVKGLPGWPIIQIHRDTGTEHTFLEVPDTCDQVADIFLEWNHDPNVRVIAGNPEEEKRVMGDTSLVGDAWLRAEIGRASTDSSVKQREFLPGAKALVTANKLKCDPQMDMCGKAIPFDGSGRMLFLTDYSEGDCQHYGCRLYDPVTKTYATPPDASSWASFANVPPGPCGLYRFDRSGKYFLIDDRICKVGGACERFAGRVVAWIGGETDVGTNG